MKIIMMRTFLYPLLIAFLLSTPALAEDTIFFNADIVTMEAEKNAKAFSAILISEGYIRALGTKQELLNQAKPSVKLIDLNGHTVMPGFIEPHTHADIAAFFRPMTSLSGSNVSTVKDVLKIVTHAAGSAGPGEWLMFSGFDLLKKKSLRAPTIQELDKSAPNNPVFIISQNLHSAWVNTLAFEKADITPETKNPSANSYFEKDANGKLTGYAHEVDAVSSFNDELSKQIDIKNELKNGLSDYAKLGISTISTTGLFSTDKGGLFMYEYLSSKEPSIIQKLLNFIGVLPDRKPTVRHFVYLLDKDQDELPNSVNNGDDFFKVLGVKFWYDGILKAGEQENQRVYDPELFQENFSKLHKAGWQVAIHANHDWAIKEAIEHTISVNKKFPRVEHRHRLEHALLLKDQHTKKIIQSGMSMGMLMGAFYHDGDTIRDKAQTDAIYPVKTAADANIPFTVHSDAPAYPRSPLQLVQAAVTRTTRTGEVIGKEYAISIKEGLKAITINAARQLLQEDKIGSLKPGKYADLVILDQNPLKTQAKDLENINVIATYVNGKEIYRQ